MLTVPARRSLFALVLAPVALAARAAGAQDVRIIRPSVDGPVAISTTTGLAATAILPISDDEVRGMIERYEPSVLSSDADANVVTIVLDNMNNYVRSSSRPARVLQVEPGQIMTVRGDSVNGVVMIRPNEEMGGPEIRAIGNAVAITTFRRTDPLGESNGVLNTGYDREQVLAIATKRFGAGTLTKGQLIVSVVRLK